MFEAVVQQEWVLVCNQRHPTRLPARRLFHLRHHLHLDDQNQRETLSIRSEPISSLEEVRHRAMSANEIVIVEGVNGLDVTAAENRSPPSSDRSRDAKRGPLEDDRTR